MPLGYEDTLTFVYEPLLVAHFGQGGASDDYPVLAPVVVILKAQTRAWLYNDPLYLEAISWYSSDPRGYGLCKHFFVYFLGFMNADQGEPEGTFHDPPGPCDDAIPGRQGAFVGL